MSNAPASLPADLLDADVFWQQLEDIYGLNTATAIVEHMSGVQPLAYWINPLGHGFKPVGEPVADMPQMYWVDAHSGLSATAAATHGDIYIQNPSSRFAVTVLDPQPDEEILDLAAAPGGKTIAMAAMMGNSGRIAAVEPIKPRFHRLRANVARCGVSNVSFYQRDGRGVGRAVGERFDRVLLDAPCSSEARMRWHDPKSYQHWSLKKVKETQRKQKSLLRSAYASVKPGGVVVYCTCSLSVAENEAVVAHLLKRSDAVVQKIPYHLSASLAGLTHWRGKALHADLNKTLRIIPAGPWDGFYVALLRKPGL